MTPRSRRRRNLSFRCDSGALLLGCLLSESFVVLLVSFPHTDTTIHHVDCTQAHVDADRRTLVGRWDDHRRLSNGWYG